MILKIIDKISKVKSPIKYWKKKGLNIGEGCEVYSTASFGSEPYLISIGNHVRINSGVNFITHDGGCWVLRGLKEENKDLDLFGRIVVGNNVHIGTNATIMPGITIGNNCIIGCGAIVTKNIPDNSVVVGIPARVLETVDEYYEKHKEDFLKTKLLSREEKKEFLLKHFQD